MTYEQIPADLLSEINAKILKYADGDWHEAYWVAYDALQVFGCHHNEAQVLAEKITDTCLDYDVVNLD